MASDIIVERWKASA